MKLLKFVKRYLFLILLFISCLAIVPGCFFFGESGGEQPEPPPVPTFPTLSTVITLPAATTTTMATTATTIPPTTLGTGDSSDYTSTTTTGIPTATKPNPTTVAPATTPATKPTASAGDGTVSFPDTLFIGDSRTDGLRLYGRITDADFFAATSLNVFKVWDNTVSIRGLGNVTLEKTLQSRQYKTVYIMLGINEIGYPRKSIADHYRALIERVKQLQPNAKIVIQSTIHITANKQNNKTGLTNANVNELNKLLQGMADGDRVFYLDLNTIYDNASGALDNKYTGDGVHFYSRYYPMWRDYLYKTMTPLQ